MSYVPIQELLTNTKSIYKLVVLASRRAQELSLGAPRLVESDSEKLSSIALEEIAQNKVRLKATEPKKKKT